MIRIETLFVILIMTFSEIYVSLGRKVRLLQWKEVKKMLYMERLLLSI